MCLIEVVAQKAAANRTRHHRDRASNCGAPDQAPANAANDGTDRSVPAAAMTVIMATLPAIYMLALYAMIADGCRAHRHV